MPLGASETIKRTPPSPKIGGQAPTTQAQERVNTTKTFAALQKTNFFGSLDKIVRKLSIQTNIPVPTTEEARTKQNEKIANNVQNYLAQVHLLATTMNQQIEQIKADNIDTSDDNPDAAADMGEADKGEPLEKVKQTYEESVAKAKLAMLFNSLRDVGFNADEAQEFAQQEIQNLDVNRQQEAAITQPNLQLPPAPNLEKTPSAETEEPSNIEKTINTMSNEEREAYFDTLKEQAPLVAKNLAAKHTDELITILTEECKELKHSGSPLMENDYVTIFETMAETNNPAQLKNALQDLSTDQKITLINQYNQYILSDASITQLNSDETKNLITNTFALLPDELKASINSTNFDPNNLETKTIATEIITKSNNSQELAKNLAKIQEQDARSYAMSLLNQQATINDQNNIIRTLVSDNNNNHINSTRTLDIIEPTLRQAPIIKTPDYSNTNSAKEIQNLLDELNNKLSDAESLKHNPELHAVAVDNAYNKFDNQLRNNLESGTIDPHSLAQTQERVLLTKEQREQAESKDGFDNALNQILERFNVKPGEILGLAIGGGALLMFTPIGKMIMGLGQQAFSTVLQVGPMIERGFNYFTERSQRQRISALENQ